LGGEARRRGAEEDEKLGNLKDRGKWAKKKRNLIKHHKPN